MIYDLALSLVLLGMLIKKRKVPLHLLGRNLPKIERKGAVIWIHAVSVGETKAATSLIPHIKESHPDSTLIITSITETGHETAKALIPEADHHLFLPLDISFVMRRFVRALKPDLLIVLEGDYWYNMLREAKRLGGKVAVVNGKLSERSSKRYRLFKRLFRSVDLFCVQNELYQSRYQTLNIPQGKLLITGNLKFDIPKAPPRPFNLEGSFITLGSNP